MTRTALAHPRLAQPNIVLGLVSAAHAVNHAFSILMQVQIYPLILDEFHLTNGDIGLMVGVGTAVSGFLQFAFSYLSRYVARRVLIGVGQVVMGVSTALAGLTPGYPLFFLWNTLARLAGSPQHPVGNSIISDHFEQKARGLALSMHVTGGNIGTVAAQILGAVVVAALGWRMTLYVFAALAILMGLAVVFLVDDHKSAELAAYEAGAHQRPLWSHLSEILRERNIFFIMIASTIAAGGRGLGVLTTYVPLYFNSVHLDKFTFDLLNTLMLIGAVVGPAVLGRVSDSAGRKRTLFWTYGAATVISLVFISLSPSSLAQLVIIFLLGTTYSESPLLQAFLADSTMKVDRDLAFGLYFTITFGIGSIWTTLLGYFIDAFGFQWGFYVMAATYIGAALLLLPTRDVKEHRST